MRNRHCFLLAALVPLTLLSSCMRSPLSGTVLHHRTDVVDFQGYLPTTGAPVTLYIHNIQTFGWDVIPHAPILEDPASGYLDSQKVTWYVFDANDVVLPSDDKYWSYSLNRNLQASVRASVGTTDLTSFVSAGPATPADAGGGLTGYGATPPACWSQYFSQGGYAIKTHCAALQSPSSLLLVPCGGPGKDCCFSSPSQGQQCDGGTTCVAGICQ